MFLPYIGHKHGPEQGLPLEEDSTNKKPHKDHTHKPYHDHDHHTHEPHVDPTQKPPNGHDSNKPPPDQGNPFLQ